MLRKSIHICPLKFLIISLLVGYLGDKSINVNVKSYFQVILPHVRRSNTSIYFPRFYLLIFITDSFVSPTEEWESLAKWDKFEKLEAAPHPCHLGKWHVSMLLNNYLIRSLEAESKASIKKSEWNLVGQRMETIAFIVSYWINNSSVR